MKSFFYLDCNKIFAHIVSSARCCSQPKFVLILDKLSSCLESFKVLANIVMCFYIDAVIQEVEAKNSNEVEFIQSVREVLTTLEPVIREYPAFIIRTNG